MTDKDGERWRYLRKKRVYDLIDEQELDAEMAMAERTPAEIGAAIAAKLSDTPRTDAALLDAKLKHAFPNASFVHADFARQLERELAATEPWNLICPKCGSSTEDPCGWPTNCPVKR